MSHPIPRCNADRAALRCVCRAPFFAVDCPLWQHERDTRLAREEARERIRGASRELLMRSVVPPIAFTAVGRSFVPNGGEIDPSTDPAFRKPAPRYVTKADIDAQEKEPMRELYRDTDSVIEQEIHPLARVAFATDPRVVERATLVYDSEIVAAKDDEERNALRAKAIGALLKSALERADSPEGAWLREAEALAARLGKAWDQQQEGMTTLDINSAYGKRLPSLSDMYPPHLREMLGAIAGERGLYPIPFPAAVIAPGGTYIASAQSQIYARGRFLVLSTPREEDLSSLLVNGIRVGHLELVVAAGPVPAAVFAPRAFPLPLPFGKFGPSQFVRIFLKNAGPSQLTVHGVVLGSPEEEFSRSLTRGGWR